MLKNYLTIAFRNLVRNKIYSLVNVLGLTVGMASCLLMLLYVQHELSYDRFHRHAGRIFRLITSENSGQPAPVAELIATHLPEVRQAVRVLSGGRPLLSAGEKQIYEYVRMADAGLFSMFDFEFVAGDPQTALQAPNSMVISTEVAAKLFGTEDPLGSVIRWDTSHEYRVTGVVKMPSNTHIWWQITASMSTLEAEPSWRQYVQLEKWLPRRNFLTYLLLKENASTDGLAEKALRLIEQGAGQGYANLLKEENERLVLQSLLDIHLRNELDPDSSMTNVYIMSAIAFFLLFIACINFVNLSTARGIGRAREVGIRKTLGAQKGQLIRQFLGESVLLVLVAAALALCAVEVVLPWFSAFTQKELFVGYEENPLSLLILAGIVLVTGLLSGLYPAFVLSAFRPSRVLKGKAGTGRENLFLRHRLVEFQFGVSVVLIAATLIVYDQLEYARTKRLGFEKEQILIYRVGYPGVKEKARLLKQVQLEHEGVVGAARFSVQPFSRYFNYLDVRAEGAAEFVQMYRMNIDEGFFDLFNMKLAAGRGFKDEPSDPFREVILNKTAAKRLGFDEAADAIGRPVVRGQENQSIVVGVVEDFHYESIHHRIEPLVLTRSDDDYYQVTGLKIRPEDMRQTLADLEKTWRRIIPDYPFNYWFIDGDFDRLYRGEERLAHILVFFSGLAMLVACLGIFALGVFTVERRTKEIGVRKVLGATVRDIVFLLSGEFTRSLLIANLVAWPTTYWVMSRWLGHFAYRVDPGWSVFLASGGIVLVVTWLAVGGQALKAALSNPVDALRYE